MGLDDLKRKFEKDDEEQKARLLSIEAKERKDLKNKIALNNAFGLPILKSLENDFWEYSYKVLDITKLKQGYLRRKTFLGIINLSSIETGSILDDYCPILSFHFDGKKEQESGTIKIKVMKSILYFKANYGFHSYGRNNEPGNSNIYASHESQFNIKDNDIVTISKWLEDQFVHFVKHLKHYL